ncbi:MAG: hypothetical protein FWD59_07080 [Micrococcales bacterium]|nr:hypothetical protein [Micrococcales bacterium]
MTTLATGTTIKVPSDLRDFIRAEAAKAGTTQADYVAQAVRELSQRGFLRAAAEQRPDDEYVREARQWDNADLAAPMRDDPGEVLAGDRTLT